MKGKAIAKSVLVMIVVGTLVSAQQASAESVFTPKGFDSIEVCEVNRIMPAGASGAARSAGELSLRSFAADTVETFDVEIEEEKGPGMGKQLLVFAIITAIVGYAVIELLASDDEPAEPSTSIGKEPPLLPSVVGMSAAISRSR